MDPLWQREAAEQESQLQDIEKYGRGNPPVRQTQRMSISVRSYTPADRDAMWRVDAASFGIAHPEGHADFADDILEADRMFLATDGPQVVGVAGNLSFRLSVPGGDVPFAGVTMVGVLPTHRRRGCLTQLMRRCLDDAADHGEPLAALWASESVIYGRFGFGCAVRRCDWKVSRHDAVFNEPVRPAGAFRLVGKAELLRLAPPVYEAARLRSPGAPSRPPRWWPKVVYDPEMWRDGATPWFFTVYEKDTGIEGYVMYRVKQGPWSDGASDNTLHVGELVATTTEAYRAMWHHVFSVDLIRSFEAPLRPWPEPLLHMLADPRRLRTQVLDSLFLRILDVPAALTARCYPVADRLVLDVTDPFRPFASGRWILDAGPDGAECKPTEADADVHLDIRELASVYLGGLRIGELACAGRIKTTKADVVRRADVLFGWHTPPWTPGVF
jgi:predicted acetyltransferase